MGSAHFKKAVAQPKTTLTSVEPQFAPVASSQGFGTSTAAKKGQCARRRRRRRSKQLQPHRPLLNGPVASPPMAPPAEQVICVATDPELPGLVSTNENAAVSIEQGVRALLHWSLLLVVTGVGLASIGAACWLLAEGLAAVATALAALADSFLKLSAALALFLVALQLIVANCRR